jgi:hypothetical protein
MLLIVGIVAAFIEGVILQPTIYWKNAVAHALPFTVNPAIIYRGTTLSILNECQQMGLQFALTAFFQRIFEADRKMGYTKNQEFLSATMGGVVSAFVASPMELVMIRQQLHGGSILRTTAAVAGKYGYFHKGLMRGLLPTMARDALYVFGMLGFTPVVQDYLERELSYQAPVASLYASFAGGVLASVPSHPFDIAKTCMQGDLARRTYGSMSQTLALLWQQGGIRRISAGCFWRTVNITLTIYIVNECRLHFAPLFSKL